MRGRGTRGCAATAVWNRSISVATSASPEASGVTCTLQPFATAKSWLFGSRAAIQIGIGSWMGFGEAVVFGKG